MQIRILSGATAALGLALPAAAQGTPFQTPGMPTFGYRGIESSQATRFSSEFNPAFSFVVDALGDYVDASGGGDGDGFGLELRTLEIGGQAYVDPRAWAYFILATEGEEVAAEEAAVHWIGFESNSTLRAGRFFIDFGKQMQLHPHELRTVERPLVLRAYLGEEVKGDGIQWDHWVPAGDATAVRWSLGVFGSLLPEESEFFEDFEAEAEDRKDFDDLSFSARLTGFTEVSEASTAQLGVSARLIPDYMVEFGATGDAAEGLSSYVYGVDATWGWVDPTGQKRWTAGGEYLVSTGESTALNPAPGTVDLVDETVSGFYVFADHAWSLFDSAGLQYSLAELADGEDSLVAEVEAYWTHQFSEFQRLRLGLAHVDSEVDDDAVRFAVQYTAVLGAHGHGISW